MKLLKTILIFLFILISTTLYASPNIAPPDQPSQPEVQQKYHYPEFDPLPVKYHKDLNDMRAEMRQKIIDLPYPDTPQIEDRYYDEFSDIIAKYIPAKLDFIRYIEMTFSDHVVTGDKMLIVAMALDPRMANGQWAFGLGWDIDKIKKLRKKSGSDI